MKFTITHNIILRFETLEKTREAFHKNIPSIMAELECKRCIDFNLDFPGDFIVSITFLKDKAFEDFKTYVLPLMAFIHD